ncbi:hypothetical protein HPP92_011211 [Vanilla planifolia]|uniref:Uncharacterized protein n=1 Tax=Vanilla planifolia TaxID=51239 RepID=A0A835V0I8_VANPL|nr:hypothetical protein HPP92_011211 [Vanilla planifolia]
MGKKPHVCGVSRRDKEDRSPVGKKANRAEDNKDLGSRLVHSSYHRHSLTFLYAPDPAHDVEGSGIIESACWLVRNNNFGRVMISMQMLTLLFCPPLIPIVTRQPMRTPATPVSPISYSVSSARCIFAARPIEEGSCSSAAYCTAFLTVTVVIRTSSWVT